MIQSLGMCVSPHMVMKQTSSVYALVSTPATEVDTPAMQLQPDVSNSVCQVEPDNCSSCVCGGRDGFHVEDLACPKVYAAEQHEGELFPCGTDALDDVIGSQQALALPRSHCDDSCLWIQSMMQALSSSCVLVRRERSCFHQDLGLGSARTVK